MLSPTFVQNGQQKPILVGLYQRETYMIILRTIELQIQINIQLYLQLKFQVWEQEIQTLEFLSHTKI